jgi:4-diphosphocytidyl-2-C-methyl-D-erythritol kinase
MRPAKMKRCRLRACAKINLSLRVLGKRADGYHELDTYFLQIDLADELFFETTSASEFELSCNWSGVPLDESNLCTRAYRLITQALGKPMGVRLRLEKRIPMGAGLGGGSSDAAVTLVALNHLFEAGLSEKALLATAQQLGSDVPFFLYGGLCHGAGRGEILTPLEALPDLHALIVTPTIELSTKRVYENLKIGLTRRGQNTIFADLNYKVKEFYQQSPGGQNDLEPWVLQQYPALARIKQQLLEQKAWGACMTGSGSAVFGLFDRWEDAEQAQRALQSEHATHLARPVKFGKKEIEALLNKDVFVG